MKLIMKLLRASIWIIILLLVILIILSAAPIGNLSTNDIKLQQTLEIGNNTIRYIQKGSGKDILFIHGSTGSIEDWTLIINALPGDYRITAFDRLCHGYSTCNDYQYDLTDNAELVKSIIDSLGLQDPMIIGHSYGGVVVAQLLATGFNDTLEYMIIESPLYNIPSIPHFKLLGSPILGAALATISKYTVSNSMIESSLQSLSIEKEEKEKIINERKIIWSQPKAQTAMAREVNMLQLELDNLSNKYSEIKANVTVLTGSDYEITFRKQSERFSNVLLNDTLIILPYANHYMPLDKSKDIAQLIDNILRD